MRTRRLLLLFAALAMIAAACGGGGAEAAAECDGEVPEDTTVEVWMHEGSEFNELSTAIASFNSGRGAELGIEVAITGIPEGQYTDQVKAAAAAGDLPDVIEFDGPTMANFAWAGSIFAMEGCISDELRNNMLPSLIEQGTYADQLWGIGTFDSGLGLWAWRSALEEVGAPIPSTPAEAWSADQFEGVLRDLKAAGYEFPLDIKPWYGSQGEWFAYAFAPMLWSAGGSLIDRGTYATADGALNSQASVDVLTRFQGWVNDGLIDMQAADDSNFLEKRSPISWVGHWMYSSYKEAAGDDLVLLPLPDFGNGTRTGMGSWAWAIANGVADGDAAMAVIEFMVSDDVVLAVTGANGAVPGTKSSVAKSSLHAPGGELNLYVQQLEGAPNVAMPRALTPAYPTMTSTFTSTLDDIFQGKDVKTALDEAVATIDADIDANEGYPAP
ncbi:MAG: extracellular solute-binding protein [Acidimicrobiia bacterium]|nr:extracellular solute-binding protein [Acidimicrobiia bacterium]